MYAKTFEDYIKTALLHGFDIVQIEEARVTPHNMNQCSSISDAANGIPLHLLVKIRKPITPIQKSNLTTTNALSMLPKKLNWSNAALKHPKNAFYVNIPQRVCEELYEAALHCCDQGISVDAIDSFGDFPLNAFASLKKFATTLRNSILHETGVVILKGLDLDVFGNLGSEKSTTCSKIAYFLICSHIGAVDGSARGRLFDVKNSNIGAMEKKSDNVLFSVSDCEGKMW